jgi:hypothetical protein
MSEQDGWGQWLRRLIEKYFVFIAVCIILWALWYFKVVPLDWFIHIVEKLVVKLGFNKI